MAVSKRTRFEVLRRDNYTCRYCRSTENALTVDHVTPVALGGTDKPDNLVAACKDCNSGKSSSSPDAETIVDVSDDAMLWAEAMRVCIQGNACELMERVEFRRDFHQMWTAWKYGDESEIGLPDGWEESIDRWREIGLDLDIIEDAARKAMTRPNIRHGEEFRYMAGIIWRTLDDIREDAARYVEIRKRQMGGDVA